MKGSMSLQLSWVALDRHVLLVALRHKRIYLSAYIGAVKGVDYDTEAIGVAGRGSMVWTRLAEIYFKGYGSGPVSPLREGDPFFDDVSNVDYGLKPPILEIRPLDKHVLAVAVRAPGDTWRAFIGAVSGEDFVVEANDVVSEGTPIPHELAQVCFEDLARGEKWQDAGR